MALYVSPNISKLGACLVLWRNFAGPIHRIWQVSLRGFGARSQFGVRGIRLYSDGPIPLTMPDGQGQTGTVLGQHKE